MQLYRGAIFWSRTVHSLITPQFLRAHDILCAISYRVYRTGLVGKYRLVTGGVFLEVTAPKLH